MKQTLHFNRASITDVAWFLDENHYIGSIRANWFVFVWRLPGGLWGEDGDVCATAVFRAPIAQQWGADTLELSRLARNDDCQLPLTSFIAKCIRYIRLETDFNLLVSYADPVATHHGGIYQAGSWLYVGRAAVTKAYKHSVSGQVLTQRGYDSSASAHLDPEYVAYVTEPKYTYVRPLTRAQRRKWQARALPYPKPREAGS